MALVLIKEDGTGIANANSYAAVADGDAYFEGHFYPLPWSTAASDSKAAALVMATRLIDSEMQFNGIRAHDSQALQWPRERCPDPDRGLITISVLLPFFGTYIDADVVPKGVVDATCETARELMIVDRTSAAPGEGIAFRATGAGATFDSTRYDKSDTRPIISKVAQAMLAKFGALINSGGGAVKLVRS